MNAACTAPTLNQLLSVLSADCPCCSIFFSFIITANIFPLWLTLKSGDTCSFSSWFMVQFIWACSPLTAVSKCSVALFLAPKPGNAYHSGLWLYIACDCSSTFFFKQLHFCSLWCGGFLLSGELPSVNKSGPFVNQHFKF